MKVTILLVGYNSEPWLSKCLETLAVASSSRLQLCFVDNLNNPGLGSIDLSAFDTEILKTPHPMGFADANNFGLKNTQFASDVTLFLNQDTVSTAGWIDGCIWCFANNPEIAVLSPGLRSYDLEEWEPNLVACMRESGLDLAQLESDAPFTLRNVTAAAMLIRTPVLRAVGPFDPIFGSYYEDYDLCRRVRCAGHKIGVCPTARVGHFSGSVSSDQAAKKRRIRNLIRNRLINKVRDNSPRRITTLLDHVLWRLPRNIARGLLRTESSQPVWATLLAHWDLLKIADRLISASRDKAKWASFLNSIDWHS